MDAPEDSTTLRTTFLPSTHGFSFPNSWEEERAFTLKIAGRSINLSLRGRCGGMSFAALDYHRVGAAASELEGRAAPDRSTPLARYIWRRQFDSLAGSLGRNMRMFYAWTLLPTGTNSGTAALTRRRELGRLLVSMRAGRAVPLGLITADRLGGIGLNHQVVAYAATRTHDRLRIHVYDPNLPLRDDVYMDVSWSGTEAIEQRAGEKAVRAWRGLFVEWYRAATPPSADQLAEATDTPK